MTKKTVSPNGKEITPSLESMNLPESIGSLTDFDSGLVVVTGGTGSGKSALMANFIQKINKTRKGKILSVEDTVGFYHENDKCKISKVEVTGRYDSPENAIRRNNPSAKFIFIDEMRNHETVAYALSLAETGHLVFMVVHAYGVVSAIDSMIESFPTEELKIVVAERLADSLRGVVAQNLLHAVDEGDEFTDVVPLAEMLIVRMSTRYKIQNLELDEVFGELFTKEENLCAIESVEKMLESNKITPMAAHTYLRQIQESFESSATAQDIEFTGLKNFIAELEESFNSRIYL